MENQYFKRAEEYIEAHTIGGDCSTIQKDSALIHTDHMYKAIEYVEADATMASVEAMADFARHLLSAIEASVDENIAKRDKELGIEGVKDDYIEGHRDGFKEGILAIIPSIRDAINEREDSVRKNYERVK